MAKKIKAEALSRDVLVALIGDGYSESEGCGKELKIAMTRARKVEMAFLLYNLGARTPRFLEEFHAPDPHDKPNAAVEKVFKVIDAHLMDEESGGAPVTPPGE